MVYQWKDSARVSIDAQKAGERLELIEQRNGQLTPELVLADAEKKSSPLHDGFEWNNSAAAEAYRIDQARYLLRSIVIVTDDKEEEEVSTIRAFVNVSVGEEDGKSYITIGHAMSDPDLRRQVLARAYRELQQWADRYHQLEEFASVRSVIKRIKKSVEAETSKELVA